MVAIHLIPALVACTRLRFAAVETEQLHVLLVKSGVPRAISDVHSLTFLVRACALLGRVGYVWKVFNGITERIVVS
jgi:hypothetical protein